MRLLSLAPLRGPGLEALAALGDLEVDPWSGYVPVKLHSADELIARTDGVDVLIVEADHVPGSLFEARPAIRIVASCRADPVNIDIEAATRAGIPVVHAPGRNAEAVADLTVGLMYTLLRGIVRADDDVRASRWIDEGRIAYQRYRGRELRSMTVGLVGCGAVGQAVARRLSSLARRVLAADPFADPAVVRVAGAEPVELEQVLEQADIVSIHAPLNAATRGLLGEAEIGRIKPGAFFVNTARFGIAEEEPLLRALREGRLQGAAFDHFPNEFLPSDHPLLGMTNVVLTPHIGGATEETEATMTSLVAAGIASVLDGREPVNVINPEALSASAGRESP